MRTGVSVLFATALIIAMMGCAAQKQPPKSDRTTIKSEILHERALNAIEGRKFIIEATEFYMPHNEVPIISTDSYLSMQGSQIVIKYPPTLYPNQEFYDHINVESQTAEITEEKCKKNGDRPFRIKIEDNAPWKNWDIFILLYKDTNQCFVRMHTEYAGSKGLSFRGSISPIAE